MTYQIMRNGEKFMTVLISNEAYELFYTMFLEVCNKHAPIEEISFSSKKRNNPWITKSLKRSIRKKHALC